VSHVGVTLKSLVRPLVMALRRSLPQPRLVEFTDREQSVLLRALFELWITQSAFDDDPDRAVIPIIATIPRERIDALVRKLGGDPNATLFGAGA
jgi:hypothetical protein